MTARPRGITDYSYDFDDFIELDNDDLFSDFSEDWEDLCSDGGARHERTYSSVLRGELAEDLPPHTSIPG